MGDPRQHRKKYTTPSHPWQRDRIAEEKVLLDTYGLRNKKEVWKSASRAKQCTIQAKRLIRERAIPQSQKEEKDFLARLKRLGYISPDATIEEVLSLNIHDVLARRLQTQIVKHGLAATPRQARQFIIHGHISVNGKKVDATAYTVTVIDELSFRRSSALAQEDHPERVKKREEKVVKTVAVTAEESEFVEFAVSEEEAKNAGADVINE